MRSHFTAMMRRTMPVVIVLAALLGRGGAQVGAQSEGGYAPAGWDSGMKLGEVRDENPDPNIVEITLVARLAHVKFAADQEVEAWTYNGLLPGPLIRTSVGNRLIVHFKNELPAPTTVHWHGVRVPIEMDGVPDISQPEVKRGESFTYDFVVRDAGLYWYHPHVMSAAQVGYGLYGALLVEDPADGVNVADQLTVVLSDISASRGVLDSADSGGSAGMVFGREGDYVLANGKYHPTLRARSGAPQRWRIVNAAKSRYFWLDLGAQPFTIIGRDGGIQEYAETSDLALIAPGERLDLIVTPTGAPGTSVVLRSMLYNRGYGSVEYRSVEELFTVAFTSDPPLKAPSRPTPRREIVPPSTAGATTVDMTLTLPPLEKLGHSEFQVNGLPFWKAKPFLASQGETQIWVITNKTTWDHPFHLHGFFFLQLDDKGVPRRPLAWKDTLNVPMDKTERLLVRFDERPGTWMFHCHILDHADGGLMGTVQVGPVAEAAEHHHH